MSFQRRGPIAHDSKGLLASFLNPPSPFPSPAISHTQPSLPQKTSSSPSVFSSSSPILPSKRKIFKKRREKSTSQKNFGSSCFYQLELI
ncbi:hypothetical protein NL676_004633 [Syzygium grande]|nr:hypothetical protein NL676_004633 [Syzygium grande]